MWASLEMATSLASSSRILIRVLALRVRIRARGGILAARSQIYADKN